MTSAVPGKPEKKKPETLDEIILRLVAEAGPGKSVDPSAVAKIFREDNWEGLMREVRLRAIHLAKAGQIAIYRKGKPADPDAFKGVYRLGLPSG